MYPINSYIKSLHSSLILVSAVLLSVVLAGCGKEEEVKPPEPILPQLTTSGIEYVTPASVFCTGAITDPGNLEITEKGLCWDDDPVPEVTNSKKAHYSVTPYTAGYRFLLTDLLPETVYYVRAYAITEKGTSYGNEVTFTTPADLSGTWGTVTDVEGNVYKTVSIGTQVWTAENLKTTKFNDGSDIPMVTGDTKWSFTCTPTYCWYDNDEAKYKDVYGALYNFYVAQTGKICPEGWHVPTDDEWILIESFLGGSDVAGKKMKEAGFEHWLKSGSSHEATNESGFTSLPGGLRAENGRFYDIGEHNYFWSSTQNYTCAWYRVQSAYGDFNFRGCLSIRNGGSLRCVKD